MNEKFLYALKMFSKQKQKHTMFSLKNRKNTRNVFSTARGAATEKAVSPIRRRVRGTTRSPDDEARSADRAGISAAGVSKSEMFIQLRDKGNEEQQQ